MTMNLASSRSALLRLTVLCTVLITLSAAANAQASRTWVSGVGDDANPCSRTAPCKTWAGAISKTAANGEMDALDPGGFGAVTITKSMTIDGGGGQVASVLVSGTNGIVVAGGATDVVTIRNISIDGLLGNGSSPGNAGINGIRFTSGAALHIEHCYIFGFNTNGIDIEPNAGAQVFVEDTTSENNANDGLYVSAPGISGLVRVTVSHSKFSGNQNAGVEAGANSRPNIHASEISGNTNYGLLASAPSGSAYIGITDSGVNNNGTGVQAGGAATSVVRMASVSMFSNNVGINEGANGTVQSFGNNYNVNPGAPNGTNLMPQ